ncbi:MAG: hypothetical protein LIO81_12380 [Clostridiales bacterium]|nr:hypothetical protein [Clostridiales bacterium]
MRNDHRFRRSDQPLERLMEALPDGCRRFLPLVPVVSVILILLIVIVVSDHKDSLPEETRAEYQQQEEAQEVLDAQLNEDGENGDAGAQPQAFSQDTGQEDEEEWNPYSYMTDLLQKDSIPDILSLMQRYFQARIDADVETLGTLYGKTESLGVEMLEVERAKLRNNSKYVNAIDNIVTYVINTDTTEFWLVYTVAEIQFYTASTKAPMIMWTYVRHTADGGYQLVDPADMTELQKEFASETAGSNDVRRLAASVNGRLREALSTDEDLREIYGVIHDGSPVWGEREPETEAEVVILDGSGEETAGEIPDETLEEAVEESTGEAVEESAEGIADGIAGETQEENTGEIEDEAE